MTQCRKPGRGVSKATLKALQKSKMMGKFFARIDPTHRMTGLVPVNKKEKH